MECKYRKQIFWAAVGFAFFAILAFNILTPLMSDDYSYSVVTRSIHSFGDLLKSEYGQYMTWTGRSVNHIILKLFLKADKWVFDLCNSINFIVLTLLIYYNIEGKKKFHTSVYLLINLFLWLFAVQFKETILWETGACNYLWGSTTILGFVTLFKYAGRKRESIKQPILWGILLFLTGIIAGWCNENTSGGGILLILAVMAGIWREDKRVKPWMWTGLAGMLVGLTFMVAAPGNRERAAYADDNYGGILKYAARAYKITLAIDKNFFVLLLIFLVLFILLRVQGRTWRELEKEILYLFVFAATCYALVMAPTPMDRAYFGAGVFLIIGTVQCFVKVTEEETIVRAGKTSFLAGLCLYMAFSYVDNIVNTARIYRDFRNRDALIWEQITEGRTEIRVPLLHEGFESKYSFGYDSDLAEDSGYWVNVLMSGYYGVDSITGVPMEEWEGY